MSAAWKLMPSSSPLTSTRPSNHSSTACTSPTSSQSRSNNSKRLRPCQSYDKNEAALETCSNPVAAVYGFLAGAALGSSFDSGCFCSTLAGGGLGLNISPTNEATASCEI